MVAIAKNKTAASAKSSMGREMPWRLIERFQTLEPAQQLMAQLEQSGQPCRLVMADGIAVIARRSAGQASL